MVLRPDPTNPYERGGVLNPAAALHNGVTYIFYRAVAETPPNFSRILIATCNLAKDNSIETVRLGRIALARSNDPFTWEHLGLVSFSRSLSPSLERW